MGLLLLVQRVLLAALVAGRASGVAVDCGRRDGGGLASIDDLIFTAEAACAATCGACAGASGGFLTCAASDGAFRCAEPDAASLLSMAIVATPTVDVSCDVAADLAFDGAAACAAICGACGNECAGSACATSAPKIAVDPATRTQRLPGAPAPESHTAFFGAVRPSA